jgi:pre-mRNA-processing factor 19
MPDMIVDVRLPLNQVHVVAATEQGTIVIGRMSNESVQEVALFRADDNQKYTAGALHPDGLIYVAVTTNGELHVGDFKSQTCASTLNVETQQ